MLIAINEPPGLKAVSVMVQLSPLYVGEFVGHATKIIEGQVSL